MPNISNIAKKPPKKVITKKVIEVKEKKKKSPVKRKPIRRFNFKEHKSDSSDDEKLNHSKKFSQAESDYLKSVLKDKSKWSPKTIEGVAKKLNRSKRKIKVWLNNSKKPNFDSDTEIEDIDYNKNFEPY